MKSIITDPKRWLLHFPIGAFTAWAGTQHWVYCFVMLFGFLAYEVTEDWRIKDKAYIDIQGFLWGLAAGIVALRLT